MPMDIELENNSLVQIESIDEVVVKITSQPKRQYTQVEID